VKSENLADIKRIKPIDITNLILIPKILGARVLPEYLVIGEMKSILCC
jgi:hypothetical protein